MRLPHVLHRSTLARRLAAGLALLALAAPPLAAQDDPAAVAQAFEAYRTAVLASDGRAALDAVDAATVRYYGAMLDLALDADSATVAREPLIHQLLVLALRGRVSADTLRAMDPVSAFVYGVDRGWIGRESVERIELGRVTVRGDRATATLESAGRPVPTLQFGFSREDGRWRFDLTSFQSGLSAELEAVAKRAGMTGSELVEQMLASVIGEPAAFDDLWHPVGR
ncbi:hypothetical protein [Rubrivirga sp.]|uniref:hypothetical protein n=1 Tax=Rubrivirga sp. TaxID=1885344 RepID=UPI003B52C8E9